MRIRACWPALLAGWASVLAAAPAWAADETRIETIAGYEISRVNDPKDAYPCRMVHGYADPNDNNAANALAFGELEGMFIVSIVYEHWKWPAETSVKARFSVDKTLIDANASFLGNSTYLAIKVPNSHLPAFNAGKKIILGFKDGTADFELAGFKPAFEATKRCNRDAAAAKAAGIGSGIAATPPSPAPSASAAATVEPAPPTDAPLPSEDRAVAYLFGLYDRWAFDACDVKTTGRQRSALDARMAALKPEMTAVEADMMKQVEGKPDRCPPASVIDAQLKLLLDATPEDFVAKMDPRAVKEFRGIVQPILARLKPAAANAPTAGGAQKPLPADLRIAAYLLGVTIQDVLLRCDLPTTARQRSGLDAKVEALRPEMAEIEATLREAIERQPCPKANESKAAEKEVTGAINGFIEKSPEDFAATINARRDGIILRDVRKIVDKVRPPTPVPNQARMSAYLWGLLLQDKIAQCDIATTGRQRTGLDAKIASMKDEMSPYEAALRAQIKGQVDGCPNPQKAAEIASTIDLLIGSEPETFAAEMDRRAAAKPEAATAPAAAKDSPSTDAEAKAAPSQAPAASAQAPAASAQASAKPASCGQTAFPQTRADLVAALKERLQPLGVQDVVAKPRATANHHGYTLTGADVGLDVDGADGKIVAFSVRQDGDSSKREAEVVLASAAYLVATFTRAAEDTVTQEMRQRLGATPASSGQSEKFDTATVFYTKPDGGHVSMLIDNADAGDCKP